MKNIANLKWSLVNFGDVVSLSKTRSQDPLAEGFERFIGLEHLEPGDLRVRSWGNLADSVTFTSVFRPGQVLFGKRRAYQRKVAVADFSGVCSGDIYVMETKDANVLLPELLPFICQTDAFYSHAVRTSAGSLSPRTNWTSLSNFSFSLPPLAIQASICKALSQANDAFDSVNSAVNSSWNLLRSLLIETFNTGPDPLRTPTHAKWPCKPLGEFISVRHGWAFKGEFFNEDELSGPQLLIPGNFTEYGWFDLAPRRNKHYDGEFPPDYLLAKGDLLLLMTDLTPSATLLGAPGLIETKGPLLHNQRLGKVIVSQCLGSDEDIFKDYLYLFFMSEVFRRQVRALSAGSTVSHSSPSQICRIAIPCPNYSELESIVAPLKTAHNTLRALKQRAHESFELVSKVREELLR